jgi:hypothetical protein
VKSVYKFVWADRPLYIIRPDDPGRPTKVMMAKAEGKLIIAALNNRNDVSMLEWGSGGSTTCFSYFTKQYFSIEHNEEWFGKVTLDIERRTLQNVNYKLVPACKEFAKPKNHRDLSYQGTPGAYFEKYIDAVGLFSEQKIPQPLFDVVLIDGRARTHCALKVLPFLKPNAAVFIHDFYNRKQYHKVFEFYDEVAAVRHTPQTLVQLSPKNLLRQKYPELLTRVHSARELSEILNRSHEEFEWK